MGGVRLKLNAVFAAGLVLAGCAGQGLGPEYLEIGEEESGLQFYAPGLAGGYRKFISGQDEKFITRVIGIYGPVHGKYPDGQLILFEMPPNWHFRRVDPPEDLIDELSEFEGRAIVLGPKGTAVNAIGRIDYAAFRADELSCIVFLQPFGTIDDAGRGTRLLEGYYCRGRAAMMTDGEAVAIVTAVGHREYGPVEPPPGWNTASAAPGGGGAAAGDRARSEAYTRSAVAQIRAGDYESAIRDFDAAIRLDPANARAYFGRGTAYWLQDEYDRAIRDFDAVIRLDPDFAPAYSGRGRTYREKGDYDRAFRDFDAAIRLDPANADAYTGRGIAYWLQDEYDRAIRDFDAAIRFDAASATAYRGRGMAYRDKGDYESAIRDFDAAIRLDPDDAGAYYSRGLAYRDKGDDGSAIRDFDAAIRLDPDDPEKYRERALAHRRNGDEDRALADLDRAIAILDRTIRRNPGDAANYNDRCWTYVLMRRAREALADCNESLRLRPDVPAVLDSRALAYWLLGERDKARRDLARAREIDPDYLKGRDRFREFEAMF